MKLMLAILVTAAVCLGVAGVFWSSGPNNVRKPPIQEAQEPQADLQAPPLHTLEPIKVAPRPPAVSQSPSNPAPAATLKKADEETPLVRASPPPPAQVAARPDASTRLEDALAITVVGDTGGLAPARRQIRTISRKFYKDLHGLKLTIKRTGDRYQIQTARPLQRSDAQQMCATFQQRGTPCSVVPAN